MLYNRVHVLVPLENHTSFKLKLLDFYKSNSHFVFLDSNDHNAAPSTYKWLAGAGQVAQLEVVKGEALKQLRTFYEKHKDWLFGYLSYDLKNELEELSSNHTDICESPLLSFFVPQVVFKYTLAGLEILVHKQAAIDPHELIDIILSHEVNHAFTPISPSQIRAIDTQEAYIKKVSNMLSHIARGDIYEANFCTQFTASNVQLDAVRAFNQLNSISKSPFAAYAAIGAINLISASPERFVKKEGTIITSQPIKGTAKRSQNKKEDEHIKNQLVQDPKERSENVMIVDLVRNDLSRIAVKGSVKVTELFAVYSFEQVHQMVSTITAQLEPTLDFIDVLKATFPMGSMTGAPKLSAMKLIEQEESFKRGIYSGALGYITPTGDMDFNVVIRTIIYNTVKGNLSLSVGSAITIHANPEREYAECLLKARALFEVLAQQGVTMH